MRAQLATLLLLPGQPQTTTAQQDAAADTQALLSFKHAGNAANTWLDSWSNASSAATSDSSGPCGSGWNQDSSGGNGWFRVQCDRSGGRVIYIHAYDIALVGSVAALAPLDELRSLSVWGTTTTQMAHRSLHFLLKNADKMRSPLNC